MLSEGSGYLPLILYLGPPLFKALFACKMLTEEQATCEANQNPRSSGRLTGYSLDLALMLYRLFSPLS